MADTSVQVGGTGFVERKAGKKPTATIPVSWAIGAIILVAFAFGGGGSKYGLFNLIVQLTALVALSFHRDAFFTFWKNAPLLLRVLAIASIILPVIYVVPLPANVWSAMPGRELVSQSYELIGVEGWAALSVDPIRTLVAATSLILPLAILAIGWKAERDDLILFGWIFVGLGLLSFVIGIPQALGTGQQFLLYPENRMDGVLFGAFANRNSSGLFLVGVLALATVLPPPARFANAALFGRIIICAILLLAVILTRSRTALVLASVPLGFGGLRAILWQMKRNKAADLPPNRAKNWMVLGISALAIAVIGGLLITAPGRVNDTLERFNQTEDARAYIWEDALYSADRYWPVGSGTGTFDDVFQIDESLENMTLRRAGRAHNDYIEAAIETGLAGVILIIAWLLLIAWLALRGRHSPQRWIAWGGGVVLLVIALQSVTDYPLRNLSMLTFGGYALLIMARFSVPPPDANKAEVLP